MRAVLCGSPATVHTIWLALLPVPVLALRRLSLAQRSAGMVRLAVLVLLVASGRAGGFSA
eukprot:6532807-Pyramimonas_sp.AAC.1